MPRQIHSEPTTWGAELAKANNNAQELYTRSEPMTGATSGAAGSLGTVPAPAAGQQNHILSGAATWVAQNTTSNVAGTIHEIGSFEVSRTAANSKSLILGGLEFKWSQASLSGGVLYIGKAAGITRGTGGGGCAVRSYSGATMSSGVSATNPTLWSDMANNTPLSGSIVITAAYQYIEYDLFTRGESNPSYWRLLAFWTGSDTLLLTGTYIGPRIT